MASLVLKTLSVLLGLFFIFVGIMKITPRLSKDMHKDIQKSFIRYAKVFPFSQTFGFKVPSKWYRRIVGALETVSGIALVFLPGVLKELANVIILVLMIGATYTHYIIGDRFERTAPAIVFTFMLTCRLVVYLQVQRKLARERNSAAVTAVSGPAATVPNSTTTETSAASHPSKEVKQD